MGDAWGVVCIPTRDAFRDFHPDLLAQEGKAFVDALFAYHGFQADLLSKGRFQVANSLLVGDMICLDVSDEGWPYFCEHVVEKVPGSELYASIYSEYGLRSFYARNAKGETWSFSLDDDGDESDSEGLSDGERRWLALLDEELKVACPPLLRYLRDRDFDDGDFNWDRFVRVRHDGKLRVLEESLTSLHTSLSTRTVHSCVQFFADISDLPATDPGLIEEAESFLERYLEGFVQVLADCAAREPDTFFGEWVYGFATARTGQEDLPRTLRSPRFTYDETKERFLLVPR